MHALEVLMRAAERASVRCSKFQTRLRQIDLSLTAAGTLSAEIAAGAVGGIIGCVTDRGMLVCKCVSAHHTTESGARIHRTNAVDQGKILKGLIPDLSQALVVSSERRQEFSGDDGRV